MSAIKTTMRLLWLQVLLCMSHLHGAKASPQNYCVDNYYFNDGYCVGPANMELISFKSQFYPLRRKGALHNSTFCTRAYPRSSVIEPAVVRNKAQVEALRLALRGEKIRMAYVGWKPFNYTLGPVTNVIDLTTKTEVSIPELRKMIGSVFAGRKCESGDKEYTSTSYDTESYSSSSNGYTSSYTSSNEYTSSYTSSKDDDEYTSSKDDDEYTSSKDGDYTSSSIDDDSITDMNTPADLGYSSETIDYSTEYSSYTTTGMNVSHPDYDPSDDYNTEYSSGTFLYSLYASEDNACFYNWPLIMKRSGMVSVLDLARVKREFTKSQELVPFCMYEIEERPESTECANLVTMDGVCQYANPTDDAIIGDGQFQVMDSVVEFSCFQACRDDSFCLSYQFTTEIGQVLGTCRMYAAHPVRTVESESSNETNVCVDLRNSSTESCNDYMPSLPELPAETHNTAPSDNIVLKTSMTPTAAPTSLPTPLLRRV